MNRLDWADAARHGAVSGALAAGVSTLALLELGRRQDGSAAAPLNAASHWLWGDESLREDRPTWAHTGVGLLTQTLASVLWATLYAATVGRRPRAREPMQALLGGVATSAVAYAIDYSITPKRLTPGYEHRLDGRGMLGVYAALAAGFALGNLLLARR